jgi:2,3-diaminopropionate biosynthesis protein SbnB
MSFDIVGGAAVRAVVDEDRSRVVDIVRATYERHHRGESVNPRSCFLRFPDKPEARIIALPAFLGGRDAAGIKWISSFPANIETNLARASSVLILNDYATGYAYACLEAAHISAARTAASAVLAAEHLVGAAAADTVLIVGAGVLGRTVADFLLDRHWRIRSFRVHDADPGYARELARYIARLGGDATPVDDAAAAFRGANLVVLVTTAGTAWITDPGWLAPGQCVLNVSLRDLSVDCILAANNVLDDVDHCLNANTSPHLTEQAVGHRGFIDGTLAQVMAGEVALDGTRPTIFSPFGLGILDLALGQYVHAEAARRGLAVRVPDFFGPTERWSHR